MLARFVNSLILGPAEKATVAAYAAIVAMTAGMTILIMSGVDGDHLVWGEKRWFSHWVIFAGALSGGIGLSLARGWMGAEGVLGSLRATVGGIAIAFMSAMVGGLLIDPILGVVHGPVLVMAQFIDKPWLSIAWLIGVAGAHVLLVLAERERQEEFIRTGSGRAVGQLSRLSQENLYRLRSRTWR